MEVQIREKCWKCDGTGQRVYKREPSDLIEACDCKDGHHYSWMDLGELVTHMKGAHQTHKEERASNAYWES